MSSRTQPHLRHGGHLDSRSDQYDDRDHDEGGVPAGLDGKITAIGLEHTMRRLRIWGLALIVLAFGCSRGSEDVPEPVTRSSPPPVPSPRPDGIEDARGDALVPEAYLDSVSAHVSKNGRDFEFSFTLAEAVPPSFDVAAEWDGLFWSFCLDTDPRMALAGYPFSLSTEAACELIVIARSTGGAITSILLDRRPLENAEDALTVPVPIAVDGATVTSTVPARRLGNPSHFRWVMKTSEVALPLGNDNFLDLDEVPDGRWARWPRGG
jgi:hypothetical protein